MAMKYGFIDKTGEYIIKPKYDWAGGFNEGLASVRVGTKCGFINKAGKFVIQPEFDAAGAFGEDLAPVRMNGQWAYIDKTGKTRIDYQFCDRASCFVDGFAVIEEGMYNKHLIDKTGRVVVSRIDVYPKYEKEVGLFRVYTTNHKAGYIDRTGKFVINPQIERLRGGYKEGLLIAKVNGKWGCLNKNGDCVIKFKYDDADGFSEGLAAVKVVSKWGFVDKTGNTIINPQFHDVMPFSEGLAAVNTNGKWGYIDKSGSFVISPQFHDIRFFREGLAAVNTNGKWGYIDKSGNIIINPNFDDATVFDKGLAKVKVKEKWGYVNKKGEFVIKPLFDFVFDSFDLGLHPYDEDILNYYDHVVIKGKEGFVEKHGLVDKKTGELVLEPQYEDIGAVYDGLFQVRLNGKYGFVDVKTGNMIIKPQFDDVYYYGGELICVGIEETESKTVKDDSTQRYEQEDIVDEYEYEDEDEEEEEEYDEDNHDEKPHHVTTTQSKNSGCMVVIMLLLAFGATLMLI